MRELEALRSEIAEFRRHQSATTAERRSGRSPAWLSAGLIVIASWAVAAQTPPGATAEVEQRLTALERLIRKGPGNATQVTGPFEVVGSSGPPVLLVTDQPIGSSPRLGRIQIGRGTGNNFYVKVLGSNGQLKAQMGEAKDGVGSLDVYDVNGKLRADVYGKNGLNVYGPDEKAVIALAPDSERGNAGGLRMMNLAGRVLASMGATAGDGNSGAVSVWNSAGRPVAGLTAGAASGGAVVVANTGGVGLAQMSVTSDGRGLVQVFGRNQNPVAVLTQATEYPGGLLQIYNSGNSSQPVANLTVAQGGGGLFQLSSSSGVPTVEAGTLQSGRGIVRVGPQYKCNPIKPATPVIGIPGFEDCLVGSIGEK